MNSGRKFQFGQSNNLDPLNKVADLFDIQYDANKGQSQWEQEVKGILSKYRTSEQVPVNPEEETRDVHEIQYKVIGYDKYLMEQRVKQNLKMYKKSIGTLVNASELLIGNLAKEIKPDQYVDEFGNMFKKIGGK